MVPSLPCCVCRRDVYGKLPGEEAMSKTLPEGKIRLRREYTVSSLQFDDNYRSEPYEDVHIPYEYKRDEELEACIQKGNGDPQKTFECWLAAVRQNMRRTHGPCLVPGPIQKILNLPVRQVYFHGKEVYRIEFESKGFGRIGERLFP